MSFQIYKRNTRRLRKLASRWAGEYDGSRWELHKGYDTKEDADKALAHLLKKEGDFPRHQYKMVEK